MVSTIVDDAGIVWGKVNLTVVAFLLSVISSASTAAAGAVSPLAMKEAEMKQSSLACITISLQSSFRSPVVSSSMVNSPSKVNLSRSGLNLMS